MVLRYYRNPLLKGMPQRGNMVSVKHHGSGKRTSKKNTKGPTYYAAPHLAFFEPAEFDNVVALLAEKNARYRHKTINGFDRQTNPSWKRSRFPGQHARCWYCGRIYVWGGNGITGNLMCSGSRHYFCWNSIGIDGQLVIDRVRAAITDVLYQLEGFDDQYRQILDDVRLRSENNPSTQLKQLDAESAQLAREKDNLVAAMRMFGPREMIRNEIEAIEEREHDLARRRYLMEKAVTKPLLLPKSVAELRADFEAQFQPLNSDSFEFAALLKQIVPEIHVYLVRLIDGGHLMPRARMKLNFSGIAADVARVPLLDELLTRVVTVDLFEPPQRERIREEAIRLEAAGRQQRQIARELREQPRQAAVFNALSLHRQMLSLGLASPYVAQCEPPNDYIKFRRHKNGKYRFTRLDGYVPPEI